VARGPAREGGGGGGRGGRGGGLAGAGGGAWGVGGWWVGRVAPATSALSQIHSNPMGLPLELKILHEPE